jgi:hypothetical protein
MLKAVHFIQEFPGGSSLPVFVRADDEKKYVVKPRGSGEGFIPCVIDYIVCSFAQYIGITVPALHLIFIDDTFPMRAAKDETQDLLTRSIGINICADYIENAELYTTAQHEFISKSVRETIFLFDILMLNIDRTIRNPNMLMQNKKLYCIDFGSSITVRNILDDISSDDGLFLPSLRIHPFYTKTSEDDSLRHIQNTFMQHAGAITDSIPNELLLSFGDIPQTKCRIRKNILQLGQNAESIIKQRLEAIHKIIPMNDEERKQKRIRNVNTFFARVEELHRNKP